MKKGKKTSVADSRKKKVASPMEILPAEVEKLTYSISVYKGEEPRSQPSMIVSPGSPANNQEKPDWEIDMVQYDRYLKEWDESDGFGMVTLPDGVLNSFIPYSNLDEVPERQFLSSVDHAKFAIDHYNNEEKTNWKFVELVRVNVEYVSGIMYYITFRAQENGAVLDFEAKVWERIKKPNEVKMCRKKKPSTYQSDKAKVIPMIVQT